MSHAVQFAPLALAQLDAIEDYIAHAGSPVTAERYVDVIIAFLVDDGAKSVSIIGVFYGGQDYETVLPDFPSD